MQLHWYDVATNTEYFKKYFTESYATLQKPIWITEVRFVARAHLLTATQR